MSITPTHSGEVQFVTFADSSKGGPRITLRLHEREELEAFVGKEGKRFMCVLVEIGDDEQPVQYPPGAVIECDANNRPTLGPAAYWLVQRCKEPEFRNWLGVETESQAAAEVKAILEIASRKDLDGDPHAMARFNEQIRGRYMKRQVVSA